MSYNFPNINAKIKLVDENGNSVQQTAQDGTLYVPKIIFPDGTSQISTGPGGSTTQIQFNSAGFFSGSTNLTWDGTKISVNGKVKVGPTAPSFSYGIASAFSPTTDDGNAAFAAVDAEVTVTASSTSSEYWAGVLSQVTLAGIHNYSHAAAGDYTVTANTSGTVTNLFAINSASLCEQGVVTNLYGIFSSAEVDGGSSSHVAAGEFSVGFTGSGSATLAAGLYIDAPFFGSAVPSASNLYGIYMEAQNAGGSKNPNPWGIFQASSTEKNALGKVNIGGSSGPLISSGSAAPENSVTAPQGSIYLRTGGGASTTLYVKESGSGNTGWKAAQTA